MNAWTCNTFEGHWPVGSAAVVVAATEEGAREMLHDTLRAQGLPGLTDKDILAKLPLDRVQVRVLVDGNY